MHHNELFLFTESSVLKICGQLEQTGSSVKEKQHLENRFTQHQDGEPKTAFNPVKNYLMTTEQSHIVPTQSHDLYPTGYLWGQSKMESAKQFLALWNIVRYCRGNMAYIQTLRSCSVQLNLSGVQK